jgi:hypothetical protein
MGMAPAPDGGPTVKPVAFGATIFPSAVRQSTPEWAIFG